MLCYGVPKRRNSSDQSLHLQIGYVKEKISVWSVRSYIHVCLTTLLQDECVAYGGCYRRTKREFKALLTFLDIDRVAQPFTQLC